MRTRRWSSSWTTCPSRTWTRRYPPRRRRAAASISLLEAVDAALASQNSLVDCLVPFARGDLVEEVHRTGTVERVEHEMEGTRLVARVPARRWRIDWRASLCCAQHLHSTTGKGGVCRIGLLRGFSQPNLLRRGRGGPATPKSSPPRARASSAEHVPPPRSRANAAGVSAGAPLGRDDTNARRANIGVGAAAATGRAARARE